MLDKLKAERERQGLTQRELANMVGITDSSYCLLETGKRGLSLAKAIMISSALNRTLDDLFLPSDLASCKEQSDEQQ